MSERWRVLVVDDNDQVRADITEWLDGEPVSHDGGTCVIDDVKDFGAALEMLQTAHYDLVILDIRDDSLVEGAPEGDEHGNDATEADVGLAVANEIRARRFVPIIFWSAVPQLAPEANPPFLTVLKKAEVERLGEAVSAVFDSGLPAVHQALLAHVEDVTRVFMADFVEHNWEAMVDKKRKGDMAHLLSRRLGASLASGGDVLAANLVGEPAVDVLVTPDTVHPMRFYIVPPVGEMTAGELIFGPRLLPSLPAGYLGGNGNGAADEVGAKGCSDGGADVPPTTGECWYVVLTPSCDFAHDKAEYVVVGGCLPFMECAEYLKFAKARGEATGEYKVSATLRRELVAVFTNNKREKRAQDRDFFLPSAWGIPALIVDFQRLAHLPNDDLARYRRFAQLDGPYAEALIAKGTRYLGRIGTPDLDVDALLHNL